MPVLSWLAADQAGGLLSLSAYMLACYLPVAILSYPFGRFLDRRPQKGWLLASEAALCALSLLLWLRARADGLNFKFLLLFGGGWGLIRALQTPLYQSLPRRLAKDLSRGTACLTAVTDAARGLGPILGGLLFASRGAALPFLINFLSFIPSIILLCFLKLPPPPPPAPLQWRGKLLPLLGIFAVGFFGVHYNVTFVALAKEAGLGSAAYGFAMGILGLGALLAFALSKRRLRLPSWAVIMLMGLINAALAWRPPLWLMGACIFSYGLLDFWFFSAAAAGLARRAKGNELTAVMGLYTAVTIGAMPLGALLWSFINKSTDLSTTLCIIAGGLLLIGILYFARKEKRNGKNLGNL